MKTKLFSFFIAVFLFSIGSKAQTTTTCPSTNTWPHCISLIGPGTPGGDWATDTFLSSLDGDVYTAVDMQFSAADIKFRQDGCWELCTGNPAGWGPVLSTESGWPSGTNTAPVPMGPNIQCPGGVWNVKFTLSTQSWEFTPGTPNAVVKLQGTGVTGSPITMTTKNGEDYEIKGAVIDVATCQFNIDGVLAGGTTFPAGSALSSTDMIPVNTTGIKYDVTFKLSTYAYNFKIATFPKIALVGDGAGGWPTGAAGEIDDQALNTTDGITYTLNNVPIIPGDVLFRTDNAWAVKYGDTPFPTGSGNGANNIKVPAGMAGNYNITLNTTTKTYTFTKNTYAIVGEAVGGWPGDPGNPGPIDTHQLSTVDGVNYTVANLVVTTATAGGGAKFRPNNAWSGDWGGSTFPAGIKSAANIPTVAGTYNLTVNVLTGAYDFGTALAVAKFDASSFKAYPNPTRGGWNITSGNDDITSVQVYDVQGKAVFTKVGASKEVNVNASELSKGVYFAKVSTANGSSTLKLIKE
jgi:hypothetical protein